MSTTDEALEYAIPVEDYQGCVGWIIHATREGAEAAIEEAGLPSGHWRLVGHQHLWIPVPAVPVISKDMCRHEWKTTIGFSRIYEDCVHCRARKEDVDGRFT